MKLGQLTKKDDEEFRSNRDEVFEKDAANTDRKINEEVLREQGKLVKLIRKRP